MDDVEFLDGSCEFDASGMGSKCFGEMRFPKLLIVIRSSSVGDMVLAGGESGGQTENSETSFRLYDVIWLFPGATFVNSVSYRVVFFADRY
jgi:hypothetical protein